MHYAVGKVSLARTEESLRFNSPTVYSIGQLEIGIHVDERGNIYLVVVRLFSVHTVVVSSAFSFADLENRRY